VEVAGKIKVDQIKETGAKVVATACANCKVQLAHLIDYYNLDVKWAGVHDLVLNALVL
jgi:Fe-S oxidoreductase